MNITRNSTFLNSTTYESYWPCSALQSLSFTSDVYADFSGAFDRYGSALISTVAARFFQAQHHYFCLGQSMFDATMTTIKTSAPTLLLKLGTWTFNRWVYNAVTRSAQAEINTVKSALAQSLDSKNINDFKTVLTTTNTDLDSKFATASKGITERDKGNAKSQLIELLKKLYEARKSADTIIQTDKIKKIGLESQIEDATTFLKTVLKKVKETELSGSDRDIFNKLYNMVESSITDGKTFTFDQFSDMDLALKRFFLNKDVLDHICKLNTNTINGINALTKSISSVTVNPSDFLKTGAKAALVTLKHIANGIYLGADAYNHWDIMNSTLNKGLNSSEVFQRQLQTLLQPLSSFDSQVDFFSANTKHFKHMNELSKGACQRVLENDLYADQNIFTDYSELYVDGFLKKESKELIPAFQRIVNSLQNDSQNADHIFSFSYSQTLILQKLLLDLVQIYNSKLTPFKTARGDVRFYQRSINSKLNNDDALIILDIGKIRHELSDDIIKKMEGLANLNSLVNENQLSLTLKDSWNPFHKFENHSTVQTRLAHFLNDLENLNKSNILNIATIKKLFNEIDYHLTYTKFIEFVLEYYSNPVELQEKSEIVLDEITSNLQTHLKNLTDLLAHDNHKNELKVISTFDQIVQSIKKLLTIYQNKNLQSILVDNPVKQAEQLERYQKQLYDLVNEENLAFIYLLGIDSLNNKSSNPFNLNELKQIIRDQSKVSSQEYLENGKNLINAYVELLNRLSQNSLIILGKLEGVHSIGDQRAVDIKAAKHILNRLLELDSLINLRA